MVNKGSLWSDGKGQLFRILEVTQAEGETWVFYRTEPPKGHSTTGCKEYNCLIGAFEQRFSLCAE
jgi:hypothetical protein